MKRIFKSKTKQEKPKDNSHSPKMDATVNENGEMKSESNLPVAMENDQKLDEIAAPDVSLPIFSCSLLHIESSMKSFLQQNLEPMMLTQILQNGDSSRKFMEILLNGSVPQIFEFCSRSSSDLLYQLCTTPDANLRDRIQMMITWLVKLQRSGHPDSTKPNSKHIRGLASILWQAHAKNLVPDLKDMIGTALFGALHKWLQVVPEKSALKLSIDSLMCSICCIRPEYFKHLLVKMNVLVMTQSSVDPIDDNQTMDDDNEQPEESIANLSNLTLTASELQTIAMACQSPPAISQLLDSGLLNLFSSAILEFCRQMTHKDSMAEASDYPMVNVVKIAEIVDFMAEICSEGELRDWLGSDKGSAFWDPILMLLCNTLPSSHLNDDSNNQPLLDLESAVIKFFSNVTSCHPRNQDTLTTHLLSVIRMTGKNGSHQSGASSSRSISNKASISGFTLRLVLKVLLESEKIVVAVSSEVPLLLEDDSNLTCTSNHPSREAKADHLYIKINVNTTCQEILDRLSVANDQPSAVDAKKSAEIDQSKLESKDIKQKIDQQAQFLDEFKFTHTACPEMAITGDTTISQILTMLTSSGVSTSKPCINLNLVQSKDDTKFPNNKASNFEPFSSSLQVFSGRGGLSLLASYLPAVNPKKRKRDSPQTTSLEIPQQSLAALGLFMKLPAYSELLLRDEVQAQCLLRLILGVTTDGEGNDIQSLALSSSLPTLPFEILRELLDTSPLTTEDEVEAFVRLRLMTVEIGAIHLILNCISIFTHEASKIAPGPELAKADSVAETKKQATAKDKSQVYWEKGTGYGTGSREQSWSAEQALKRQKMDEACVTVLLQILSSFVNPGDAISAAGTSDLPPLFSFLLEDSCLMPVLWSYLRNDSVMAILRHIPIYRAILQLLRALSISSQLRQLLDTKPDKDTKSTMSSLLYNMKSLVDTYASKVTSMNKTRKISRREQAESDDEDLDLLVFDIQETAAVVHAATFSEIRPGQEKFISRVIPLSNTVEEKYLEVMKKLQFDTFEMIAASEGGYRFTVAHRFESKLRMSGDRGVPARVKRLAQETVTLSTSLPLSFSSSVFVRCDTDRLDVMKVLITGPSGTPYANGCFEFDVYFPAEYPSLPMTINLETTGRQTVRFNPNLYADGKVCLSLLNTWAGRPEENWNSKTSSFLQVLVSIQSLILVPEPYFNEPGYEKSRGTPSGNESSRKYNSNIYQACINWAMLEQLKNPSPCFKDVIYTHFWLKRNEICQQIENVIRSGRAISKDSMNLRRYYQQLKEELAKLPVPEGLEDFENPFTANSAVNGIATNEDQAGHSKP